MTQFPAGEEQEEGEHDRDTFTHAVHSKGAKKEEKKNSLADLARDLEGPSFLCTFLFLKHLGKLQWIQQEIPGEKKKL